MTSQVIYAYLVTRYVGGDRVNPVVFTWPNTAKKWLRDTYTTDGELHLPPPGRLILTRVKVNPKAGHPPVTDVLNLEEFLSG